MGQLVRIRSGNWIKNEAGCWQFEGDPDRVDQYVVGSSKQDFDSFTISIREELVIGPECPIVVTYQLPDVMLQGVSAIPQPANIITSDDVETVMSVLEWTNGIQLCVIIGARNVAKYEFLCRTPFEIGDVKYLAGSTTGDDHISSLKGLVAGDVLRCSETLLNHLFADDKLVLIYRLSMEIEMARGYPLWEENDDEPIAYNAAGDSTYFNPEWSEEENIPHYFENIPNTELNLDTLISETVNGVDHEQNLSKEAGVDFPTIEIDYADCEALDQSSTGSTGCIRLGVEGENHYNPIDVTQAEDCDNGFTMGDDGSQANPHTLRGGLDFEETSFINITDVSDQANTQKSMGIDKFIIHDSSSDSEGKQYLFL